MVLNFYWSIVSLHQFLLLYLSLSMNFNATTAFTNVQDLFSRVLLNDFYINSFYYLWTSFWYIPIFLLTILLYFFLKYIPLRCYWKYYLFSTTLFLLSGELIDYWVLNLENAITLINSNNFNNLLSNSINKYHPGLFYWTSLFTLLLWPLVNYFKLSSSYNFSWNSLRAVYLTKAHLNLVLIVFALFLGGWWALQEGSWGGWWNWDPSEVFGMLFILSYSYVLHQSFFKKSLFKVFTNNTYFICLILLIYFFIQLNFDLVSHNFGTKVNQFIDASQFFLLSLFIILLLIFGKVRQNKSYFLAVISLFSPAEVSTGLRSAHIPKVWVLITAGILSYQVLLTFSPLLNDFIWKAFQLNIVNSVTNWVYYNLLLVINLCIFFWSPNIFFVLILCYTSVKMSPILAFLGFTFFRPRTTVMLHLILISSFLLSIANSIICSTNWGFQNTTLALNFVNDTYFYYTELRLNNDCLDLISFNFLQDSIVTVFNFILTDTTPEIYSFFFNLTSNFQQQSLNLGNLFFHYTVNTFDVLPQSLVNCFIVWGICTIAAGFRKKLIIF
jgi:hypothetical protein